MDFAGRWGDLFRRFADNPADLLTTTLMYRHEQPRWPLVGQRAGTRRRTGGAVGAIPEPADAGDPAMLDCVRRGDGGRSGRGHYEFTLATAALDAG